MNVCFHCPRSLIVIDNVLPFTIAVACLLMLGRLFLGPRLRARLDNAASRRWNSLKRHAVALYRRRSVRQEAARAAEEAIRKARAGSGQWEGNVYKPDTFKRPRKPH